MSAVSKNVTPASSAASTTARVPASSTRPPKLLQPRPTTVTASGPRVVVRTSGDRTGSVPGRAEHTQPVFVRDLRDLGIAVAGRAQCIDEPRQPRDVAQRGRDQSAVEVGAERDVVDSHPLCEVVDVAHDLVEARLLRELPAVLAQ